MRTFKVVVWWLSVLVWFIMVISAARAMWLDFNGIQVVAGVAVGATCALSGVEFAKWRRSR